jgi:glycosyltransferase involved in cell wall biosynthesis
MLPHLDAARAAGFRVEVACQVTRFGEDVRAHADALHDLPMRRFPLHPANVAATRRLTRLIREGGYCLVHAHNPTGGFVGRLSATLSRTGCVRAYTAHGFHFHRHGGRVPNAVYRGVERFAGHLLSDAVFVINREDRDAALSAGVVPDDRLFLTGGVGVCARTEFDPARVSPEETAALRREWGAAEGAPVLTVVGEMIPRKRQGDALRAFTKVLERRPDALLVLAGDGAKLADRQEDARRLGVADSCRFLGFRRDVARILSATDVFVFPSQQEGLPCSIQEALCMEVPVVATDVRGNADLVDETCGRLVPLGETDALAGAVLGLLDLPVGERRALGRAGREKMLRLYDRPVCVGHWQKLYAELLDRHAARAAVRTAGGRLRQVG